MQIHFKRRLLEKWHVEDAESTSYHFYGKFQRIASKKGILQMKNGSVVNEIFNSLYIIIHHKAMWLTTHCHNNKQRHSSRRRDDGHSDECTPFQKAQTNSYQI